MPADQPPKDLPSEFALYFDADGDACLRLTLDGARRLLPRLARHQLSLPSAAPVSQVRAVLHELSRAELSAGMAQLDLLLTRTDLSTVERDVLESLAAMNGSTSRPTPVSSEPSEPASVVKLSEWRSARKHT